MREGDSPNTHEPGDRPEAQCNAAEGGRSHGFFRSPLSRVEFSTPAYRGLSGLVGDPAIENVSSQAVVGRPAVVYARPRYVTGAAANDTCADIDRSRTGTGCYLRVGQSWAIGIQSGITALVSSIGCRRDGRRRVERSRVVCAICCQSPAQPLARVLESAFHLPADGAAQWLARPGGITDPLGSGWPPARDAGRAVVRLPAAG